jgi:hypothetical protein
MLMLSPFRSNNIEKTTHTVFIYHATRDFPAMLQDSLNPFQPLLAVAAAKLIIPDRHVSPGGRPSGPPGLPAGPSWPPRWSSLAALWSSLAAHGFSLAAPMVLHGCPACSPWLPSWFFLAAQLVLSGRPAGPPWSPRLFSLAAQLVLSGRHPGPP